MCQLCRTFGFEVWDLCKASVLRVLQFVSGVIQHCVVLCVWIGDCFWSASVTFLKDKSKSRSKVNRASANYVSANLILRFTE